MLNTDFTDIEVFDLRKMIYTEVRKLPHFTEIPECFFHPERKDFDEVRFKIQSKIAHKIWERSGKPQHKDMDIWLEAESLWEFIRYGW